MSAPPFARCGRRAAEWRAWWAWFSLVLAGVAGASGCRDATSPSGEVQHAAAVPDSLATQVVVGGVAFVSGPARDSLAAQPSTAVAFASADAGVAAVDTLGRVSGLRVGRTVITATAGGRRVGLPVVVRTVRYAAVSPGCALTTAGEALCWGTAFGTDGPVGCSYTGRDGLACYRETSDLPAFVSTRERFRALSDGFQPCGLTADGRAVCWSEGKCDFQPGGQCTDAFDSYAGASAYVALSSDAYVRCGLSADGRADCWGWNDYGPTGTGGLSPVPGPTAVAGGLRFRRVSTAGWSSCGVTLDGAAWCWGIPYRSALVPPPPIAPAPVQMPLGGLRFTDVTGAQCGLATTGDVVCWARDGQTAPVVTGRNVVAISGRCGLTADGQVYCWDPGNALLSLPLVAQIRLATPVPFRTVAEASGLICGIGTDGVAYCARFDAYNPGATRFARVPGQG